MPGPSGNPPFAGNSASDWLRRDEFGGPLWPAARALLSIRQALDGLLPVTLRDACQVGPLKQDELTLFARSNAHAAKLRQLLPGLVAGLQSRGMKVSGIRVRVQPAEGERQSLDTTQAPDKHAVLTERAAECLTALAGSLAPSPLRDAVQSLARRRDAG
jgi:hypothetical protein